MKPLYSHIKVHVNKSEILIDRKFASLGRGVIAAIKSGRAKKSQNYNSSHESDFLRAFITTKREEDVLDLASKYVVVCLSDKIPKQTYKIG